MDKKYRRLPGRVIIGSRASLWLGADHLLSVKNPGFSEEYMRFYYQDIQAIVTNKTYTGKAINVALGACIAITLLLSIQSLPIQVASSIGGFFLFFLVLNILMGPTCKSYIQTAVSREHLPSLRRVRSARRAIKKIAPLIGKAQGELTRYTIAAKVKERPAAPRPKAAGVPPAPRSPEPVKNYSGSVHLALFCVLLLDGVVGTADIFLSSLALTLIGYVMSMGFLILMIISLVKQHGSRLSRGMRRITVASLAYACVQYVLSVVLYMYVIFQSPTARDQWGMMKTMAYLDPFEHPLVLGIFAFAGLTSLTIGGLGMYYYSRFRYEKSTGALT